MENFNTRLKKIKKSTTKVMYCSIIFFLLGLLCFIWAFIIDENTVDNGVTLHELIYNNSSKKREIVTLTVKNTPCVFAEYDSNSTSPKYYFLMDDDYLYVGYLDYDTYQKLNKDDISTNPVTIKGVTRTIPNDVVDIAIKVYNEEVEQDFLTKENYSNYIGNICIDTVSSLVDNVFQIVLGLIFIIISIVYLIVYFVRKGKIKKAEKDTILWDNLKNELEKDNVLEYSKLNLYLTNNYIIDGTSGLTVIPYSNIAWVYIHEQRYRGLVYSRCLVLITNNNKRKLVAKSSSGSKKIKDSYTEIIEKIYEKNNAILIGYNKENSQKIKKLK